MKMAKIAGIKTYNWGIPAFRAADGSVTCPGAGKCAVGCYAQMFFYTFPNVKKAQEERLALTRSRDFHKVMVNEIERRKIHRIRVHDSGDFYDLEYASKWQVIAKLSQGTLFYAYTKNIPLVRQMFWPPNFTMIYSYGGKFDHLINPERDRHSRIFLDRESLLEAGYADASENDANALGKNLKVGLIYHGYNSKAFTTLAPATEAQIKNEDHPGDEQRVGEQI